LVLLSAIEFLRLCIMDSNFTGSLLYNGKVFCPRKLSSIPEVVYSIKS